MTPQIDFDAYSELGLAPGATVDDVKAAYRRAARRLHPDVNRTNPGAGAQFQEMSAAYELLLDDNKRQAYEREYQSKTHDEPLFTVRVSMSKHMVTTIPETQVVYLLGEIIPDPRAAEAEYKRESRLNLTLVLDRSNSMNGTRLDKVKVAAHQIIDHLNDDDVFSVVSFNDRAETVIEASTVKDRAAMKARVSMMNAVGGTEIFHGLEAGVTQNRRYLAPRLVNHVILLTDGYTFGDQDRSIALARTASAEGISISAMGLGQDWNDQFLDEIAAVTGGTSSYISSAGGVVRFLNDHVRGLSNVFAERMQISIAPDPDVQLEAAFKLTPNPQPLNGEAGYIPLGSLQFNRTISVLFTLGLPADLDIGFRTLARIAVSGDVLNNQNQRVKLVNDMSLEVTDKEAFDAPPTEITDALGKLALYRIQERAQEALERGDIPEATRRLENLATRLQEMGENELAIQAQAEAHQVAFTNQLTDKGRKTLKYQTRSLLLASTVNLDQLSD